MAENKKKVIVYADWLNVFIKLTDDEAGKLIKHFFKYINDLNPEAPDRLTELLFEPIKTILKIDLKKWESEIELQKRAGRLGNLKRYNIDLYELVQSNAITLEKAEEIAISRPPTKNLAPRQKTSRPDKKPRDPAKNLAVNVNDNVNDNVIIDINTNNTFPEKPEKVVKTDFIEQIIILFSERFKENRGVEYYVSNQKIERSMAGKILKAYKTNTKNAGKNGEQTLIELGNFFDSCMLITDKYLNETMSLSTIINQFNKIINILKNGNKQRKNEPATSDFELATIIANKFANDSKNG